jgi:AraC family transcriptional regulator
MRLATGQYFAKTNCQIGFEGGRFVATEYEPHQSQPWHTHEHPTFFAHIAGEHLDNIKDEEWPMPILSLTYHPNSTVHRSRVGPKGAKGINLEVREGWLAKNEIRIQDLGEPRVLTSGLVQSAALRLIRMYTPTPLASHELSDMAFELMEPFTLRRFPAEDGSPKWLKRAEDRMLNDFRKPIGLATLAKDAGVHPMHLARVFRRRHGRSVTDHLQRLRAQAAVDQILAGDSIGSAALDAGFADHSHFSRTLKAHFGYSPKLVKRLGASA